MKYRGGLKISHSSLDFFPHISENTAVWGEIKTDSLCSIGWLVTGERTLLRRKRAVCLMEENLHSHWKLNNI